MTGKRLSRLGLIFFRFLLARGTGTVAELVSLVAQVHELSDFLQVTHIEPVGTSSFKKDSSLESIFFDLGFPPSNIDEIPPRVP